jgi:hypothetical protein
MHDLRFRRESKHTVPTTLVRPRIDTSVKGRIIYDDCLLGCNAVAWQNVTSVSEGPAVSNLSRRVFSRGAHGSEHKAGVFWY